MVKAHKLVVILLLLAQSDAVYGDSDENGHLEKSSSQAVYIKNLLDCNEAELSCRISFWGNNFCTENRPLHVNKVNDKIKNQKLKQLKIKIFWLGRKETFCLPRFIDMPNTERLTIENNDVFGPGRKLSNTDDFIVMLRVMKTSKFEFQFIELESIRYFLYKDLNIDELSIHATIIQNLPQDLLKNLTMLKVFIFDIDSITSIPENFFAYNKQLEKIVLTGHPMKILSDRLLENLKNLKVFHYDNRLSTLSFKKDLVEASDEPTILSQIMFRSNRKLKEVHFHGNLVSSSIPEDLFMHNHELDEIWIRDTKITKLPKNLLKNLKSLQNVNFSEGKIDSIPENFFADNKKLEQIDFRGNQISHVPATMFNGLGESLKYFNLKRNPIEFIPENSFSQNEQLKQKIKLGQPKPPYYDDSEEEL